MGDAPEKIWLFKYNNQDKIMSINWFNHIPELEHMDIDGQVVEYIRADCVDGSKLGIMERNFESGHQEGILDSTKNIKAVWEKILRQNIEPINLTSIEILKLYLMVMEAIKAEGINAGWLKEK